MAKCLESDKGQQTLARKMMDGYIIMNVYTGESMFTHKHIFKSFGGKLNFILMSVHLPLILSGINICDSACIEFVHAILVEVFANSERWIEIFGNTLAYLMKYTCISDEIHLHI